jgi:hypothetical protein
MSAQEIEFTEEDFLIYELRHEELIEELKNIITLLSKEDDDSEEGLLLSTISTQTNEISKLVKLIDSSLKNIDQTKLVSLLNVIRNDIVKSNNNVIKALQTRKLPDSFSLIRDQLGYVEKVTVNYKTANAIN